MSTTFLSRDFWPHLIKTVSGSRQRCSVAVAYFGKGASKLLPLPKGSRLVVDASERAVSSGQTCPADLLALIKRGIAVYSVPNLHAKVFVVGRAAYIGSTNVSNRSAAHLVEAVIRTTDPGAINAARKFVGDQCLRQLTPELLKKLAKVFRPPKIPGGRRGVRPIRDTSRHATLPRLLLAQLAWVDWSESDQRLNDAARAVAKKRQLHPRSFELDSFQIVGKCRFREGDVVVQVLDDGGRRVLAAPPGNVLYVRSQRAGRRRVSFVCVERPTRRRRQVKSLARALGCTQKALLSEGVVRDQAFANALLNAWAVTK